MRLSLGGANIGAYVLKLVRMCHEVSVLKLKETKRKKLCFEMIQ